MPILGSCGRLPREIMGCSQMEQPSGFVPGLPQLSENWKTASPTSTQRGLCRADLVSRFVLLTSLRNLTWPPTCCSLPGPRPQPPMFCGPSNMPSTWLLGLVRVLQRNRINRTYRIYVYKDLCEILLHKLPEAEKAPSLPSASCRLRKSGWIIPSET